MTPSATAFPAGCSSPSECVIGFGIPLCRSAFFSDRQRIDKDYARRYPGDWNTYRSHVVRPVERVAPDLARWGVTIEREISLGGFGELLRRRFTVVVLFSHWIDDFVEFADGLKSIPEIVAEIPAFYGGLIDLCVCHPQPLVQSIKRERPKTYVRYTTVEVSPHIWCYFYLLLFKAMQDKRLDYYHGFIEAAAGLARKDSRRVIKPIEVNAHD